MKKLKNWVFWGVSKFQNVRIFRFLNNFFLENILFFIFFRWNKPQKFILICKGIICEEFKEKNMKKFPIQKISEPIWQKPTYTKFGKKIWNNILLTCISIDVSFIFEHTYGFKYHFGQIVLFQCPIMCIFQTIS